MLYFDFSAVTRGTVWCEAVITFLKLSPSQSNGWDPDEMFKYNEETYGVKSTYDSSLSSYT